MSAQADVMLMVDAALLVALGLCAEVLLTLARAEPTAKVLPRLLLFVGAAGLVSPYLLHA